MQMSKEVIDRIGADIEKADKALADLKEVVGDMRLSGMDTKIQDTEVERLTASLRSLKMFYERRKAKA